MGKAQAHHGAQRLPSVVAHGLVLALPDKAAVARAIGVGRALANHEIPIQGRDERLAAARLLP